MTTDTARSRIADTAIGLSVASDLHNKSEILKLLCRHPGARLLDIGCNVGSFSFECARAVGTTEVYGIEIDAGAAEVARAAGVCVTQADCNEPLPYADAAFDVIVANQVIEHLYFTDDFIGEVRRILRPDGQLVISTTNLAALHYRLWLLAGMQPSCLHPSEHQFGNHLRGVDNPRYGHKSVFTYRAFREFLEFHGFVIERSLSSGLPRKAKMERPTGLSISSPARTWTIRWPPSSSCSSRLRALGMVIWPRRPTRRLGIGVSLM